MATALFTTGTGNSPGSSKGDYPRDYRADVLQPLQHLYGDTIQALGELSYGDETFELVALSVPRKHLSNRPSVLLSAGVHGDEVAGVFALQRFIMNQVAQFEDLLNIFVLPCINPSGYQLGTLETATGQNLNRMFGIQSEQPEIAFIERWLKQLPANFEITLDCHEVDPMWVGEGFKESDNPKECFIYETSRHGGKSFGRKMLAGTPDRDICRRQKVYMDDCVDGLISYPEACHNPVYQEETTFDAFLNGRYTDHTFTLETPMGWPLEHRVRTQLRWLTTALECVIRS